MRRIAYVTDLHLEEQLPKDQGVDAWRNWNHILDDIRQQQITELVLGGDIGEPAAHPRFFASLEGFSWKLTPGNHDSYGSLQSYLPANTGDGASFYCREEEDAFRYLYLDTSPGQLSGAQLHWLREALQTDREVVVFLHHPVLAVDTWVDKQYPLQNRDAVKDCLLQSKKRVTLFCGHYHMVHEQTEGTIRQVISPACSFQIVRAADELVIDADTFGYRVITCNREGLETGLRIFKHEPDGMPVLLP